MSPIDVILPILISSILVFGLSVVVNGLLPFYHVNDYRQLPNEEDWIELAKKLKAGQYRVGGALSKVDTKGVNGFVHVREKGGFTKHGNKMLFKSFVYNILVSAAMACVIAIAEPKKNAILRLTVFVTTGFYWFAEGWSVVWLAHELVPTLINGFDALMYGTITAFVFDFFLA
mmetsp:Transcript_19956/g.38673  ORF Transcript_19956/g.38673 Transcript_19956/m.38673 type:complete len:173 (+) Transcript_19956:40-558(+)